MRRRERLERPESVCIYFKKAQGAVFVFLRITHCYAHTGDSEAYILEAK